MHYHRESVYEDVATLTHPIAVEATLKLLCILEKIADVNNEILFEIQPGHSFVLIGLSSVVDPPVCPVHSGFRTPQDHIPDLEPEFGILFEQY